MIRYERSLRVFAVCLSALAGYVDAVGFLSLGGFFISFMSGNSTRLAVGLSGASQGATVAGGLIASFVAGVVAGALLGRIARRHRPAVILVLVAGLLALGSICAALGWQPVAVSLMAMAMGAENTLFEREGEVSVGLTYMTGTLVKLGQRLAAALSGGDRLGWLPYLVLWAGLVGGAIVGGTLYPRLGLQALWLAVAAALSLAVVGARLESAEG